MSPPDSEELEAIEIQLLLEAAHFVRPEWTLEVDGLDGCRQLLGTV